MAMLESASREPSAAPSLQNRISAVLSVAPKAEIPQIPKSPREAPATARPVKALAVPTTHLCFIDSIEELENKCQLLLPQIDPDLWMNHIVSHLDMECCSELRCVSKHLNQVATTYLQKICPPLAHPCRFIDTGSGPHPFINKWKVLQWVNELGPHVEGNAGCSLLVMRARFTLKERIQQANESGITVWFCLEGVSDKPLKETRVILITNSLLMGSRNKSYQKQQKLVADLGCEIPGVQEYVALSTLTQSCPFRANNFTCGRTSMVMRGYPLYVGGNAVAGHLAVQYDSFFMHASHGVGAQRKLS